MTSPGLLSFEPDELTLRVPLGDTFIANLPVLDIDDGSSLPLDGYSVTSEIFGEDTAPVTQFTTLVTGNVISASLTQDEIEQLAAVSRVWSYRIRVSRTGERRTVVSGELHIVD